MKKKEENWKIKDLKCVCWNLCQKIEPFKVTTYNKLHKRVNDIKRECKVKDLEALQILRNRLEQQYREMREHG